MFFCILQFVIVCATNRIESLMGHSPRTPVRKHHRLEVRLVFLLLGLGFVALVLISSAMTAMAWLLVPLVRIHRIEARARAATEVETTM